MYFKPLTAAELDEFGNTTTTKTSVNVNNVFPSELFNINTLPNVIMKSIMEHFYTKFIYKTYGTYNTMSRGQQQYLDYMISKLIRPYYPESVSTYQFKNGYSNRTYYNITGSTFTVPLKRYIKGLYAVIYINDTSSDNGDCFSINRTYTLIFIGRGHDAFANKFNDTLCKYNRGEFHIKKDLEDEVALVGNSEDFSFQAIVRRSMDSVLMPEKEKHECLDMLHKFVSTGTKKFYESIEEPYHYNMVLYGKPGTGKTSFVHALSGVLNFPIIKLTGEYLSAYATTHFEGFRLSWIAENYRSSIIFIDEVDLYTYNREVIETSECSEQKRILLSDLLEFLDKISSGNIVILCTNHIDRLDSALIRNGRVNRKIKFDYWDQACLDKKLMTSKVSLSEFEEYAVSHDITYTSDENGERRYCPSVVSDICKEISLQRFWDKLNSQDVE